MTSPTWCRSSSRNSGPRSEAARSHWCSPPTGVEALEHLQGDDDIEVVVTDINMPRMDGLTLLGEIGKLGRRTRSVVVTAYGDMENIRTAMNKGAFDFLTKPLDMGDLQITLDQARAAVERDREADRVHQTISRYLSAKIAKAVLANPDAVAQSEKRHVSVLMSDISGFSQIAERLEPERVVELLNVYLGAMTEVVDAYDGAIDEFIGDAVLVIFGAPLGHGGPRHTRDGLRRGHAGADGRGLGRPRVARGCPAWR